MKINLRDWLTKRMQSQDGADRYPAQGAVPNSREGRADAIVVLQAEIRQLQQDITDMTNAWDNGTDQSDRQDATARLRAIENALGQKQAALSKMQGRI
jgi:hypothetical protein